MVEEPQPAVPDEPPAEATSPEPAVEAAAPTPEPPGRRTPLPKTRLRVRLIDGDSDALRVTPFGLDRPIRFIALRSEGSRRHRLHRVVGKLFPFLQKLESAALGGGETLLAQTGLAQAMKDDRIIERAIKVFEVAWQLRLVDLIGPGGKALGPGDRTRPVAACGMSVAQAEQVYVRHAVKRIFSNQNETLSRLPEDALSPEKLPRLRALAQMDAVALRELLTKLGRRFAMVLDENRDADWVNAATHLEAFQVRALAEAFGPSVIEMLDWDPAYLLAFAESFTVPEQIEALGVDLRLVHDPEALRAIGGWEVRDVTAKNDEELNRHGQPASGATQNETDIAVFRAMLGMDFDTLLKQPAPTLAAFGRLLANIRAMTPGKDRTDIIEKLKTFCSRYLNYLPPEALSAIDLSTEIEPDENAGPTLPEIVGIMDGIWGKPGLGRVFFEQHLQRPDGIEALRGLLADYREMVRRGSIQRKQDIAQIIITSSVLDRAISRFISA